MEIGRRAVGGVEILALAGSFDASVSKDVRAELLGCIQSGRPRLVVDLRQVPFVDSSGLYALVSALKAARGAGGDVLLLSLSPQVRSVVELTRLHRVFEIFEDEATAVARLG